MRLALGLVLLSPGIPMLSAGQDFLRGKQGVRNTYLRGDLNALDYSKTSKFEELGEWVRSLIELRLSSEGRFLRPESLTNFSYKEILSKGVSVFGLAIREEEGRGSWLILINASDLAVTGLPSEFGDLSQATLLSGQILKKPGFINRMDIQVWQLC